MPGADRTDKRNLALFKSVLINKDLPDEQALPLMKEKIDTLDWTEAIIVYIGLPETILREV